MSARRQRPDRGDPVTDDMSVRDIAACLGVSTGELSRWRRLAAIPECIFEARLKRAIDATVMRGRRHRSATDAVLRGAPVPARGRVDRAIAIYARMTSAERMMFRAALAAIAASVAP